ncbi:hypothetical protein [Pseudoalteromonas luteoviolacea]|uniref:hypothetical protein n=1 Tax=Pseudoalteromonas luteoviolacea TaxID=43657 RepID=UPI0012D3A3E2|nr:hypothetical protein [Pseudoalteromonas luteoviolacea]
MSCFNQRYSTYHSNTVTGIKQAKMDPETNSVRHGETYNESAQRCHFFAQGDYRAKG